MDLEMEFEDYEDEFELDELDGEFEDDELELEMDETGLLEALVQGLADAETEAEEDQFLGALAGLVGPVVKGISGLFKGRKRRRRSRRRSGAAVSPRRAIAGVVPVVVRKVLPQVRRMVRQGQQVQTRRIRSMMLQQTRKILANRRLAMRAIRRTEQLAQQFHARQHARVAPQGYTQQDYTPQDYAPQDYAQQEYE